MRSTKRSVAILLLIPLTAASLSAAQARKKSEQGAEADPAQATSSEAKWMTLAQARRAVVNGLKTATIQYKDTRISNIRVDGNFVEFDVDQTTVFGKYGSCWSTGLTRIDVRTLGVLSAQQDKIGKRYTSNYTLYMSGKSLKATIFESSPWHPNTFCGQHLNILGIFAFENLESAQSFADGMNRLIYVAQGGAATQQQTEWASFEQKLAAWRAQSPPPPLPEAVRAQRVLAENAVREKDFDSAIEHYEEGLDIDPAWPEGHFNTALLYGEMSQFADAVWHMRAYVELVPNGADTQAARDQILVWEDKVNKQ